MDKTQVAHQKNALASEDIVILNFVGVIRIYVPESLVAVSVKMKINVVKIKKIVLVLVSHFFAKKIIVKIAVKSVPENTK